MIPILTNPPRLLDGRATRFDPDMIRDMAMHEPGAGIVCLEGDEYVAASRNQDYVATWWVD